MCVILSNYLDCIKGRRVLIKMSTAFNNGYKIYMDIMTGKNCRQFRLLTWTFWSTFVQFVHPVEGDGVIVILALVALH